MYTSAIGRSFLNAYNKRCEKQYTAKAFFQEIFIPLFFDHPKYMLTAGNSPLENPKLSWEEMIKKNKPFETSEQRQERIRKMIEKIESEPADASIAVGYGAADTTAATSGQITNMVISNDKEAVYCSWIGAALGIGVTGGITILFDCDSLLLDLFEGWKFYRDYLNNYPLMKGNQINTWNAHWIAHRYDASFDPDDPAYGISQLATTNNGLLNLSTLSWIHVLLPIAETLPLDTLVGYLYSIGQANTTIGFIPFKLSDLSRPNKLYAAIFGKESLNQNLQKIENLYGTAFGLRAACQYGSIGIQAMEPKGLRAFLPTGKSTKKIAYKENNDQEITFNTYIIWILLMLNNEKLWELSHDFAETLLKYEAGAGKAKKDRTNRVKQLLESPTPKIFFSNLIPIIEEEEEIAVYEQYSKIIHEMPKDNFPYFNTLIRLQYALLNK